jgi:hypothetical protein
MNGDDQKFENFLRGFEPCRPRPLPLVTGMWPDRRRLAAAAVMLIAVGGSLWVAFRSYRTRFADLHPVATQERGSVASAAPMISSVALARAALEDQDQFDMQMNDIAPRTLPRFDLADSSLRALAKE